MGLSVQIQIPVNNPMVRPVGFHSRGPKMVLRKVANVENLGALHCRLNCCTRAARRLWVQYAKFSRVDAQLYGRGVGIFDFTPSNGRLDFAIVCKASQDPGLVNVHGYGRVGTIDGSRLVAG
jgi:hypothetical protein